MDKKTGKENTIRNVREQKMINLVNLERSGKIGENPEKTESKHIFEI